MLGSHPTALAGSRTGVFVGIGGFDYSNVIINYENHLKAINAYLGTGNAHSIAANRISYLLDFARPERGHRHSLLVFPRRDSFGLR